MCVGPTIYTYDVHQSWVKIYSRMLKIMVPVAVSHELRDGSAQEKRFLGASIGISQDEEAALSDFNSKAEQSDSKNQQQALNEQVAAVMQGG